MKRIPIVGFSKKFKRIKLPAQKAPSRFTSGSERELAAKSARKVLGEAPEYMGMSQRALSDMAAESLALRTAEKKFFRALPKELRRSRFRTAAGVKAARRTTRVPKIKVFRAKQKGAMKAYGIATKKAILYLKEHIQNLQDNQKHLHLKHFLEKLLRDLFQRNRKKTWGF